MGLGKAKGKEKVKFQKMTSEGERKKTVGITTG